MFLLLKSTQSFHPNRVFQSCRNFSMRSATNRHHGHGSLSKKILVPVADGTEELEAITIIDVLVRAGATVQVASVTGNLNVVCSRGVKLTADCLIQDCVSDTFDAIVCPGGMPGAQHLSDSHELHELLKHQSNHNKLTAAICASPAVVLAHHGIIGDRPATCYPAEKFIAKIPNYCTDPVVVDGNLITSQGPGTSLPFSLKVVEALFGEEKVARLERELVFNQH
jgi:4-methyl-5(b-hydroxyethyl)-thiazole monophosphate biosynthesis